LETLWIYDYKTTIIMLILLCIILVILIILVSHYLYNHFSGNKPKKKKPEPKEPDTGLSIEEHIFEEDILKYLKEDERIIARILKQREGSCEQGTLRLVSGFSKAKLSRLLTDMAERGVVKKEQKGKKNMIFLRSH
jgi:predicted transcriptional regulator